MTTDQSPVLYFDHLLDGAGRPTSPPVYRVRTCTRELGTVERVTNLMGRNPVWIASGMGDANVPGRKTRRAAAGWLWERAQEETTK